jgi:nicotinamidase-related amidase
MEIEQRTAANTTIVLIDYVSGFAGMIGSQTIGQNIAGSCALARTALTFGVPLVVTMGPERDPRGMIYPELAEILSTHPVVYREGSFDAFSFPWFEQAVKATQVRHLVAGRLMTDGCVLHTCLSALRNGYTVSLVVDATASESDVAQYAAVDRLSRLGATLTTWLSFASKLQGSYDNVETVAEFRQIQAYSPGYRMFQSTIANAVPLNAPG